MNVGPEEFGAAASPYPSWYRETRYVRRRNTGCTELKTSLRADKGGHSVDPITSSGEAAKTGGTGSLAAPPLNQQDGRSFTSEQGTYTLPPHSLSDSMQSKLCTSPNGLQVRVCVCVRVHTCEHRRKPVQASRQMTFLGSLALIINCNHLLFLSQYKYDRQFLH